MPKHHITIKQVLLDSSGWHVLKTNKPYEPKEGEHLYRLEQKRSHRFQTDEAAIKIAISMHKSRKRAGVI